VANVEARMTAARRRLPIIPTQQVIRELASWQETVANRVIDKLKNYPRLLEGQRYVRTGELGRHWRFTQSSFIGGSGVTLEIYNFVTDRQGKRYASLVQGINQRPIHEGRWLTIQTAMQEERAEYRAGISSILKSHGL
jgi:hypothetical protein